MGADDNHEEWNKKFAKTKAGKIFNLKYEIISLKNSLKPFDHKDHLSYALMVMAEGTKAEEDVIEIIKMINPKYFTEETMEDTSAN